ncbi:MAG: HD domain-containing protein [Halobacteriota archaeon]
MAKNRENDSDIKGYIYPDDEIYKIFEDDVYVYRNIISSPEFQRLKGISFLGTIDVFDLFDTKYKFSRYDHSIGVAVLAKKIAEKLSLDKKRTKTLIIACLLHDIGHPPLSHCLEPIFSEHVRYACNGHHTQTRRLIVGSLRYHSKFNLIFLHKLLKKYSINIPEVSSLLGGEGDPILKSLIENPFNPDTIDGINRAALTFGEKPVAAEDILQSFSLMNSEVVLDLNYKYILDAFWSLKNRIYSHYIYDPKNLIAEHFLCELFEKIANDVENFKDLVFMTDNDFLSYLFNHKKIQSFLNEVWNSSNSLEVPKNNSSVLIHNTFEKRELKKFVNVDNKSFDASLIKLSDAKKCYIRSYSAVNLPKNPKIQHMLEQKIRNNYLLKK